MSLKYMPVSHLAVFAAQITEPTTGAEKGSVAWVIEHVDGDPIDHTSACGTNLKYECRLIDSAASAGYGYPMDMDINATGNIEIAYFAAVVQGSPVPAAVKLAVYVPASTNTGCSETTAWMCNVVHTMTTDALSIHSAKDGTDTRRIAALEPDAGALKLLTFVGDGGGHGATNPNYWLATIQDGLGPVWARMDMENDLKGFPMISYRRLTGGNSSELMLARPLAAVPGETPNCNLFLGKFTWVCTSLDSAPETATSSPSFGAFSSIAVYPSGGLALAYTRMDTGTVPFQGLYVLRTGFGSFLPLISR